MQTLTFKTRTDKDGVVRLEIPTEMIDHELEIVLVMQAVEQKVVDEMGYPPGYFDETYGSFADDPLERNQPQYFDERDEIE